MSSEFMEGSYILRLRVKRPIIVAVMLKVRLSTTVAWVLNKKTHQADQLLYHKFSHGDQPGVKNNIAVANSHFHRDKLDCDQPLK